MRVKKMEDIGLCQQAAGIQEWSQDTIEVDVSRRTHTSARRGSRASVS